MTTPEGLPKRSLGEQFRRIVKRLILPQAGAVDDGILLEQRRRMQRDETELNPSELEPQRHSSPAENIRRIAIDRHGPDAHDGI